MLALISLAKKGDAQLTGHDCQNPIAKLMLNHF